LYNLFLREHAHGEAGPEKREARSVKGGMPPGFCPRCWSAEPPQVEKAGFREQKGLTSAHALMSAHARTQERYKNKNPQFREEKSLTALRPRT
jgi:hypothetical protein